MKSFFYNRCQNEKGALCWYDENKRKNYVDGMHFILLFFFFCCCRLERKKIIVEWHLNFVFQLLTRKELHLKHREYFKINAFVTLWYSKLRWHTLSFSFSYFYLSLFFPSTWIGLLPSFSFLFFHFCLRIIVFTDIIKW